MGKQLQKAEIVADTPVFAEKLLYHTLIFTISFIVGILLYTSVIRNVARAADYSDQSVRTEMGNSVPEVGAAFTEVKAKPTPVNTAIATVSQSAVKNSETATASATTASVDYLSTSVGKLIIPGKINTSVSQTYDETVDGAKKIVVPGSGGVAYYNLAGNTAKTLLVGHDWGVFKSLNSVTTGAKIYFNGHSYTITNKQILPVSQVSMTSILVGSAGTPQLTLMTCYDNDTKRIVITALQD